MHRNKNYSLGDCVNALLGILLLPFQDSNIIQEAEDDYRSQKEKNSHERSKYERYESPEVQELRQEEVGIAGNGNSKRYRTVSLLCIVNMCFIARWIVVSLVGVADLLVHLICL